MKRIGKLVLTCIGIAIVIAILSGLVNVTPPIVGATWYGWPFAWRYVIVYPGSPENYNFMNLALDALLWFVPVLAVGALISTRFSQKGK
jgi:hypothetical protein